MTRAKNDKKSDSHDFWEVSQAAVYLTGQACTLSARHIEDGLLRIQFNREVAYYARGIVRDVEEGNKTAAEGLKALKDEQTSLLRQANTVFDQSIGLIAGGLQVAGGVGLCAGSLGLACGVGVLMGLHGANNIYENGRNLIEQKSDTEGPIRKLYQGAAKIVKKDTREGNIAYSATDIGLSAYGLTRLVRKKDAWRLFRYIESDHIIKYKQMGVGAWGFEIHSNSITLKSITEEIKK